MLHKLSVRLPFAAACAALLAIPPLAAHAQSAPEQTPVEHFFQRPAVLSAKLSPSGTKIAISTSRGDKRVGLVVIDLAGGTPKANRAATFSDADITQFEWVGDDRLVYSAVDLQDGSGEDRYFARGLFSVNADGTQPRTLVSRDGSTNSLDGRLLKWNHTLLAVPEQQPGIRPDEVVIGEMYFDHKSMTSVWPKWINVRTGRTRIMDVEPISHVVAWDFDTAAEPRVAYTSHNGVEATSWRGPGEKKWSELTQDKVLEAKFTPVGVDDIGNLYVTHTDQSGYSVLSKFDFKTGKPSATPLLETPGFDFRGSLVEGRPGAGPLGVRLITDAEQTIWYDEGMKRAQAMVDAQLPGRVNRISCRRCGADEAVLLVRSFSDRDPGKLFHYESVSKKWNLVGAVQDEIDPQRMSRVSMHRIKARDGRDLPVWVTQPAGVKAGQPAPTVVLVHGGPWIREGDWEWEGMQQFLASRGYLVISPEFRGSTGYGYAHYRAGWKQWGQAMQDDVADALLWAQKQGLASNKACIAGASYGGYSTLMGLVRHPELYKCGVAWLAVTDPSLLLKGAWNVIDDLDDGSRRYMLPQLIGDVDKDAKMLADNSPLMRAWDIKAPLLLAFGESDMRVPIEHGERLRSALIKAGHPPEWVTYSNEAHGFRQVSTQVDFARKVEAFLDKHLKAEKP
ncbi:dipeptidyl aminopeptidase [Massilia eurypsychrophila]|uniref:Dipeptidyl aminopeptidase n=1 Tax=Massilia eurypsychrophila TaxID=1485217 RepID=A0A2G8TJY1_9BURK|nr:prolyl oligopeptidase family serine peptidase [Massilia eurypsychrophila]PIL45928.1 dipeptidyl aminopeptidase [Massilia eurypsychrophila]